MTFVVIGVLRVKMTTTKSSMQRVIEVLLSSHSSKLNFYQLRSIGTWSHLNTSLVAKIPALWVFYQVDHIPFCSATETVECFEFLYLKRLSIILCSE